MDIQQILLHLLLGGLLGLVGQGVRVVVGLKKLNEEAKSRGSSFKEEFAASQLLVSLLIGFCAGILAMIAAIDMEQAKPETITTKIIMSIIAAGYAGTDFIEGFMRDKLPPSGNKPKPVQP